MNRLSTDDRSRVRGLVRVAGWLIALRGPAAEFAVSRATARLATALKRAKQCGWVDLDFILTVRTNNFHAANLTYRLLSS